MLIPVKYHARSSPKHIKPEVDEIVSHLDIHEIIITRGFPLYTVYEGKHVGEADSSGG